jgi:hypothetical protein
MRLLHHFVPNVTLDLETMKAMIAEIEEGAEILNSTVPAAIETEESELLQEELGCMIIDARGSYSWFSLHFFFFFFLLFSLLPSSPLGRTNINVNFSRLSQDT